MAGVRGKFQIEVSVTFEFDDILEFVGAESLTPVQFEEIANILVANLEDPVAHHLSIVPIEESYFNDGFYDMQEDLQEMYGQS